VTFPHTSDIRGLLEPKRILFDVTPAAKEFLADSGFDPVYGARPLKRVIQTLVLNKMATMLISGAMVRNFHGFFVVVVVVVVVVSLVVLYSPSITLFSCC
jgi:ATP-dependent Clp protease ATP-binding subunit ClpA